MSYDYFLWRMNRHVEAADIDETTVESWRDLNPIRTAVRELWPTMVWDEDGNSGDDCSGATPVGAVRLPDLSRENDPLVIRASHRADATAELVKLGELLQCLVYDAQTGVIVYQPEP